MSGFQQDVFLGSTPTSNLASVDAELDAKALFIDGTKSMTGNLGLAGSEMGGTKGGQFNEQLDTDIPTPPQGLTLFTRNDGILYTKVEGSGSVRAIGGGMSNPSGVGVENNVVIFDDDPEEVKDSGKAFTDVVLSDGTGAQFNLAEFKGELANKQISDSGIVADNVVESSSSFTTDNLIIRSDGAGKNVQNSGITLTDADGLTGVSSIETAAIKITTGAGANKILTSDAVGDATWEDPSGGSRAAVQVRLTSNENLPGSLTDIEFDTIDIESDDSIIEVISDERIRVLQAGYYVVTFQGVFNPNDGSERELDIEIRKNGVLIPGGLNMTLFDESSKEDWTQISMEVIGLFAINDEISTAYEDSSGNIEIRANASMIVKTL